MPCVEPERGLTLCAVGLLFAQREARKLSTCTRCSSCRATKETGSPRQVPSLVDCTVPALEPLLVSLLTSELSVFLCAARVTGADAVFGGQRRDAPEEGKSPFAVFIAANAVVSHPIVLCSDCLYALDGIAGVGGDPVLRGLFAGECAPWI